MTDLTQSSRRQWDQLWLGIGATPEKIPSPTPLLQFYDSPSRHYHNLRHITQCLSELDSLRNLCRRADAVELAVWYHDAIYEPQRGDNEERSADIAAAALRGAGADAALIQAVKLLILATKHTGAPDGIDARILADIDLSILGRPWEEFDQYEAAIRREYANVEESAFRLGRSAILRRFLQRPSIFSTETMRQKYEVAARENLKRSIEQMNRSAAP